jgi:putative ABC transport system permease protein
MYKSYLILAVRRLLKERLYSLIKITGLSVALTCIFLIFLFVSDELSYDTYHDSPGDLYRVVQMPLDGSEANPTATTPFPLYEMVIDDYNHIVKSATRFFNQRAPKVSLNYIDGDRQFNETKFFFADSTVFDLFKVDFILGDPQNALKSPDGLVMTESVAKRYFGDEDPLGKVIRVEGRFNLVVSGVIKDIPSNSHVQFEILGAFHSLNNLWVGGIPNDWEWNICWTYVRVNDGIRTEVLNQALRDISDEIQDRRDTSPIYFSSQNVPDIRLNSNLIAEIGPTSSRLYITIVVYIGLFILFVASVNFINLSLASSTIRSKEVGVRKVLGAKKSQLITQNLIESFLVGTIALLFSVLLIISVIPWFNELTGKTITFFSIFNPEFWLFSLLVVSTIVILAGLYPAVVMSAWSPLDLFRSGSLGNKSTSLLSNGLIIIQFAVATMLIAGTWTVFKQLEHIQNQRLGFDQDQVIMIPTSFTRLIFFYEPFREQILMHPRVKSVNGLSAVLGTEFQTFGYEVEQFNIGSTQSYPFYFVTHGFLETFDIPLITGRFFSPEFSNDVENSIIVNESFVQSVGWGSPEQALGKIVRRDDLRREVIGVVSDFNFSNLKNGVEPLVLELPQVIPSQIAYIAVKLEQGNPSDALALIESKWKEFDPSRPIQYFFLDDRIQMQYYNEVTLGRVAGFFAVISVLISCFGLFGLASFTTERKSRSIGIRKVMGASVSHIVYLLSKDFLKLVIISNIIAIPLVYWLMSIWLEGFAYRIDISLFILILTVILSLLIAFISVAYKTIKAATSNPIDSLRYE